VPSLQDVMPEHLQGLAYRMFKPTFRPGETVGGVCRKCGRPLGFLAPAGIYALLLDSEDPDPETIWWWGATVEVEPIRDASGRYTRYSVVGSPRFPCVRKCGADPTYSVATLRAKYKAARAAGQPTVDL
jgi:hypothetical protein